MPKYNNLGDKNRQIEAALSKSAPLANGSYGGHLLVDLLYDASYTATIYSGLYAAFAITTAYFISITGGPDSEAKDNAMHILLSTGLCAFIFGIVRFRIVYARKTNIQDYLFYLHQDYVRADDISTLTIWDFQGDSRVKAYLNQREIDRTRNNQFWAAIFQGLGWIVVAILWIPFFIIGILFSSSSSAEATHILSPPLIVADSSYSALSAAEQRVYRKAFDEIDRNHDGSISSVELHDYYQRKIGDDLTHGEVRAMMSEADVNGDARIQLGEFVDITKAARNHKTSLKWHKLENIFAVELELARARGY